MFQFMFGLAMYLISSLPLYIIVKLLGGKTSIIKTMLVIFFGGILVSAIQTQFNLFGGILAFFAMGWLYHNVFSLSWWKVIIVWLVQGSLIVAITIATIVLTMGLGILGAISVLT